MPEHRGWDSGKITDYTYWCVCIKACGGVDDCDTTLHRFALHGGGGKKQRERQSFFGKCGKFKMVTWSSDNADIVSVNENGYVAAHKVGTATVIARIEMAQSGNV